MLYNNKGEKNLFFKLNSIWNPKSSLTLQDWLRDWSIEWDRDRQNKKMNVNITLQQNAIIIVQTKAMKLFDIKVFSPIQLLSEKHFGQVFLNKSK